MNPDLLPVAATIILVAYFMRGITGFGSGLIAIPLLAHFLPLPFVVPMVLVLDFSASVALIRHSRLQVRWDEVRPLLLPSLVGIVLGATLLVNLPREPLLAGLGMLVLFFGVRYVFNVHGDKPITRLWSLPAGFSGGFIGAMFGTGGPPFVIYLTHRLRDKTEFRGTLSGLFMLDGAVRLVTFLVMGLLIQPSMLTALLVSLPLMAAGLYLGHKVHVGISQRQQLAVVGLLLLGSGGSLLWKAWVA